MGVGMGEELKSGGVGGTAEWNDRGKGRGGTGEDKETGQLNPFKRGK